MKRKVFFLIAGVFFLMSAWPLFSDEAVQNAASISAVPAKYQKWLYEEIPYIITPKEKQVFLQLKTDKERDIFIQSFWKERDSNPVTPENEFKAEHYRRLDFVNRTFGSVATPGWKTDEGRFYIILGDAHPTFVGTIKLRVFEGLKEGSSPARSITSSYLKYMLAASIPSDAALEAEQNQIRKTFNLKDVKLVTESNVSWEKGEWQKTRHMFRLDGKLYEVAIASKDVLSHKFRIEVNEIIVDGKWDGADQKIKFSTERSGNLLDTEFTIPTKSVAVFGFEDSNGKPYFISLGEVAIGVSAGVDESNKPPSIIKKVDPVYPEEARDAQKEGIVVLKARTDVFGRVQDVKVEKSSDPAFDKAAINAVRQWVYEPAIVDGQPKSVEFTVTIKFVPDKETGGVSGSVAGGVEGGVKGGVEGGVVGDVLSQEMEKKRQEFEKDAVACKGDVQPPTLLKKVDPIYPEEARKKGMQGVVILEAKIDEYGRVMDAMILRSVPGLDQAAIDAVRQWVYEPLLLDGKPTKALFTVTVRFQLGEKDIEKFAEGAVKVRDQINPPKLVKSVNPVYPEIARQAKIEGVVILQARTDVQGRVKDAMVLRSVPLLDQAAIAAVRQWVYEPLVIDEQAKEAVFTVTVRFDLSAEKTGRVEEGATTGEILVPTLIKKVDPVYPEIARMAGIQGVVLLEATTDEKGDVVNVRVSTSIPELDQAAIEALKQWKYEPFLIEGKPKGVVFTVTIRFALR